MFGRKEVDSGKQADLALDPRLAKFFDQKKIVTKRAKCLRKFTVAAPEKEAELFQLHCQSIYTVIERSITFFDSVPMVKEKKTLTSFLTAQAPPDVDEFCSIMRLLIKLMIHNPAKILELWNYKNFCRHIGRSISRDNTPKLRQVATEMLLIFIDILRPLYLIKDSNSRKDTSDKEKLPEGVNLDIPLLLLEEAVNFDRLNATKETTPDGVVVAEKLVAITPKWKADEYEESASFGSVEATITNILRPYEFAIAPFAEAPTKADDLQLFSLILNYVTTDVTNTEKIKYFYQTIRQRILSGLFPSQSYADRSSKKLKSAPRVISVMLVSSQSRKIHPDLQNVLVPWLKKVYEVAQKVCYADIEDFLFMIEILNISLDLPAMYADISRLTLDFFLQVIKGRYEWIYSDEELQEFISRVCQNVANVFYRANKRGVDSSSSKVLLSFEALNVYQSMILESKYKLIRRTWNSILLQTHDIISSWTLDSSEKIELFEALTKFLFDCWCRSQILEKEEWIRLYDLSPRIFNVHGVNVWKQAMISLAVLINDKFFAADNIVKPTEDKDSPYFVGMFSTLNITSDHASILFDRMLLVLGGGKNSLIEKSVEGPKSYVEAIKAIMEIVDVWIGNSTQGRIEWRNNSEGVKPKYATVSTSLNTILNIFGSWLFRAAELCIPDLYEGHSLALEGICRIFSTHLPSSLSVDNRWVARFFALTHTVLSKIEYVHLNLESNSTPGSMLNWISSGISTWINSSAYFLGVGHRGAFALVPLYLQAIESILDPKCAHIYKKTLASRKPIVHFLASLISLEDFYGNEKIVSMFGSTSLPFAAYKYQTRNLLITIASSENEDPVSIASALQSMVVDAIQQYSSRLVNYYKLSIFDSIDSKSILNDACLSTTFKSFCAEGGHETMVEICLSINSLRYYTGPNLDAKVNNVFEYLSHVSVNNELSFLVSLIEKVEPLKDNKDKYDVNLFDEIQAALIEKLNQTILPSFIKVIKTYVIRGMHSIVDLYFKQALNKNPKIAKTALDCLEALSYVYEDILLHDEDLIFAIISQLCQMIESSCTDLRNSPESPDVCQPYVLVAMLNCLSSWILNENASHTISLSTENVTKASRPAVLLMNREIGGMVFSALESGLLGQIKTKDSVKSEDKRFNNWPSWEEKSNNTLENVFMTADSILTLFLNSINNFLPSQGSRADAVGDYSPVKGSSLNQSNIRMRSPVYQHDTHDFNFNDVSSVNEALDPPVDLAKINNETLTFSYQGSLISVTEYTDNDTIQFDIRDITGKHSWQFKSSSYEQRSFATAPRTGNSNPSDLINITLKTVDKEDEEKKSETLENISSDIQYEVNEDISIVPRLFPSSNRFSDLLVFIENSFEIKLGSALYASILTDSIKDISLQAKIHYDDEKKFLLSHESVTSLGKAEATKITQNKSSLDKVRLLFFHLGLLESSCNSSLRYIHMNEKIERELDLLDRTSSKYTMRVGVVYAKKRVGSEQLSLTCNDSDTSDLFNEFVSCLGWEIDLAEHRKSGFYMGTVTDLKMYADSSMPAQSVYFANARHEVFYHIAPRLPLQSRKKLIGSDPVVIVWCDSSEDYNPEHIVSGIKQIYIVIYPFKKNGIKKDGPNDKEKVLYRIEIFKKGKKFLLGSFGPLQDGMIVTHHVLSLLVRQTAIHAYRNLQSEEIPPYLHRSKIVNDITQHFSNVYGEEELFSVFFPLKSERVARGSVSYLLSPPT